jgi:hypothetical protein
VILDFGPPWRDGFNLLAPKGRKKELELIIDGLHKAGLGQGLWMAEC